MDHVALDRAGADDGDLDDEVVEAAGPHPGEEVHLRPAFHLEDADAVGHTEHVVDGRVFGRQGGQRVVQPMVLFEQVEGLADAGEHAERQHVDLEDAEAVDIVLVPADDGAVFHGGVLDRDQFVEPPLGDDEAADVLAEVAGEALDLAHQLHGLAQAGVVWVEADFLQPLAFEVAGGEEAPELRGEGADGVLGQAHGGAHLADGALAAVVDDRGAEPGAVAAVALVDVLDHLLAAFVFEIDVDVGRLVPGLGDEALEDHCAGFGRHAGDAQAVADHRVGRRAAPLAEDVAGAGEGDHVVHGEEVGLVFQLGDEGELVFEHVFHLLGRAVGVAPAQAFIGEAAQAAGGGFAVGELAWVFVAQLVEGEGEGVGKLSGAVDGVLVAGEEAEHFGVGAQAAFAVGERVAAQRLHPAAGADGGEHVGEAAAAGVVHHWRGRGDGGQAEAAGELGEGVEAGPVLPVVAGGHEEVHVGAVTADEAAGASGPVALVLAPGRVEEEGHVAAVFQQVGDGQAAGALLGAQAAGADQPTEPGPAGAVARQGGELDPLGQAEAGGGDEARRVGPFGRLRIGGGRADGAVLRFECAAFGDLAGDLAGFGVGADDAGHGIGVGDGERGQAEKGRPAYVFLGVGGAGQEGEVGGGGELGEHDPGSIFTFCSYLES